MKNKEKVADPVRKAKLAIVEMNGGPKFNKKKAQTVINFTVFHEYCEPY